MTEGQSAYTWVKQERFGPPLAQSLRISTAPSVAGWPYYHVDLNAGGGSNDLVPGAPVEGSPLNFLRAVERTGRWNVQVFFVDNDLDKIKELIAQRALLAFPSDRLTIHHGDNAELLPVVREVIYRRERRPDCAMGSILIDPNGWHGGVPWEALRAFCLEFPRFDLLLNLNVRTFRLEEAQKNIGRGKWANLVVRPPAGFRQWFNRPHWMWTEPMQIGIGSTWIQGVARTMPTAQTGYRSLGYYDDQSERGRAILATFDHAITGTSPQLSLLPDVC